MTLDAKLKELQLAPMSGSEFKPASKSNVQLLESKIGASLPRDFVSFLTTYGGCIFETECRFPTSAGWIYPGWFFDVDEIVNSLKYADEFLPMFVIPINDDGGGNNICISAREETFGHIYFRNHSIGWDEDSQDEDAAKIESMFLMASGFTEFLLTLEPDNQ